MALWRETKSAARKAAERLLDAALDGDAAAVRACADAGGDLNVRDNAGHTPLSEAACTGHFEVCELLLSRGAKVNTVSHEQKRSPLHRAAFHGYSRIVELLVDYGADITRKDACGELPVHLTTSDATRQALGRSPEKPRVYQPAAATEIKVAGGTKAAVAGETKAEVGSETKAAVAGESKAAVASETKAAVASEAQAAVSSEAKVAVAGEAKAAAAAETKAAAAAEAKVTAASETKAAAAAEAKAAAAAEAKVGAEAAADAEAGAETEDAVGTRAKARRLQRKLLVEGAGERRLNGAYSYRPDQIDETWAKDGDGECLLSYKQHRQEWCFTICNYKKWNTLYRVMERRAEPRILAETEDGCDAVLLQRPPAEPPAAAVWLKWFGVSPVPTVAAVTWELGDAEPGPAAEAEAPAQAAELAGATKLEITAEPQREFLEAKSCLDIVARDTGADTGAARVDVATTDTSGRIIETADGLFSQEELDEDGDASWAPVPTPVAPGWTAAVEAKDKAAKLFGEGEYAACASLFSGCIGALAGLQAEEATEDERRDMRTTLFANRSLACIKLGQWQHAVADADVALAADARQFKVYYRRALARRELGELDLALEDATKVCEHYMTQPAPNPEAWEMRDSIIAQLKKERQKWRDGPRARAWNKTLAQAPPKDLSLPAVFDPAARAPARPGRALAAPVAPRSAGDVEKHLQHWRRHGGGDDYVAALPVALLRKVAWDADILGTMVRTLARLAARDPARSFELLSAVKCDSLTWAMLDDTEQQQRSTLLDALAPLGVDLSPWR